MICQMHSHIPLTMQQNKTCPCVNPPLTSQYIDTTYNALIPVEMGERKKKKERDSKRKEATNRLAIVFDFYNGNQTSIFTSSQ